MFNIKYEIIKAILKNDDIVKILKNGQNIKNSELTKTQVFPYFYIPMTKGDNHTTTESKAFITMRVYAPRIRDHIVENYRLDIAVFANKDIMMKDGIPVTDRLVGLLDPLVDKLKTSIDKPVLRGVEPYVAQIPDFDGYIMSYDVMVIHDNSLVCGQ